MITGAFKESTGLMTVVSATSPAVTDNSASPGIIITQNAYFIVERITGINSNAASGSVALTITPGNLRYGNTPNGTAFNFPLGLFTNGGKGLSVRNGKPIMIINPNSKINIVIYNTQPVAITTYIELEGYYTNETAVRILDGQAINSREVLTLL